MDSNLCDLHIVKQAEKDTVPAATALTKVRFTGESLKAALNKGPSAEILSDGNVSDINIRSGSQSGGFNFELAACGAPAAVTDTVLVDLIAGLMGQTAWTAPGTAVAALADVTAVTTTSKFVTAAGTFASLATKTGSWIKVTGFTDDPAGEDAAANNGFYRVVSVGGSNKELTVWPAPSVEVAVAQDTITFTNMHHIRNASNPALTYFTLERSHQLTGDDSFFAFKNCTPVNLDLSIAAEQDIAGTWGFMGGTPLAVATASVNSVTKIVANTNPMMAASFHVGSILENGATLDDIYIQSVALSINKTPRRISAVGSSWGASIGFGSWSITGTLNAMFTGPSFYTKNLNNTATSLVIPVTDSSGNTIIITIGNMKFLDYNMNAAGKDQDLVQSLTFQGLLDTTYDCGIQFDFLPAS